ncbi:ClpP class serine protease [Sphingomonas vulcanisoli]|uniref:ClpP class serine protease n=1 Tax=Sphingomonas vulcanisoli TaxID=1658060 RepID=A0ABX0TP03_9SPHN|nr:S49 family peptidase [Sphingomonas vulcanisoli]NIJ07232.1 ClpP class serine protease [Sphingomonas vulcanisoli]
MSAFPRHLAARLFNSTLALLPAAAPLTLQLLERTLGNAAPGGLVASEEWGGGRKDRADRDRPYDVVAGVAIIPIKGVLIQRVGSFWYYSDLFGVSGYDRIRLQFMQALADDEVDAIALDIDSPGGEVAGCFDLTDTIYRARGIKPIAAILGENAFSAAYALASAADPDRFWVPRTGGTGSVGVIYQHLSIAGWMKNNGIQPSLITRGAFKGETSDVIELSKGAIERIQADVDDCAEIFFTTVARNRGMSKRDVAATEAGTFLGSRGVDAGFANAVASPDQAFRALLKQL